jgi:hypothetical protein
MRLDTCAWARTNARHGPRRGSRALSEARARGEAALERAVVVAVGTVPESYGPARCAVNERRNGHHPSG